MGSEAAIGVDPRSPRNSFPKRVFSAVASRFTGIFRSRDKAANAPGEAVTISREDWRAARRDPRAQAFLDAAEEQETQGQQDKHQLLERL